MLENIRNYLSPHHSNVKHTLFYYALDLVSDNFRGRVADSSALEPWFAGSKPGVEEITIALLIYGK